MPSIYHACWHSTSVGLGRLAILPEYDSVEVAALVAEIDPPNSPRVAIRMFPPGRSRLAELCGAPRFGTPCNAIALVR